MAAISLPSQQKIDIIEQDEMFTLRKSDWKRIKRLVNSIQKPSKFISIIYSILFGISGTAFLSNSCQRSPPSPCTSSKLDIWDFPLDLESNIACSSNVKSSAIELEWVG